MKRGEIMGFTEKYPAMSLKERSTASFTGNIGIILDAKHDFTISLWCYPENSTTPIVSLKNVFSVGTDAGDIVFSLKGNSPVFSNSLLGQIECRRWNYITIVFKVGG
jgi:hypothetical protein